MKISSARVLDQLSSEEPCLGAVFTSYSFDPGFFEDHVLRAVLRLVSDPVEQSARYHSEARSVIQATPVAVIVDAGERQPGRRLPYDLLEVSDVVFHPKAVLLLYKNHARFMVGSGNLTYSGYGGNAELFITLELQYDDAADLGVLKSFNDHLTRVSELTRQQGTQLSLFRSELDRRINTVSDLASPSTLVLLDSTVAPIMEQLQALLPQDASIDRIGLLAPFYERDGDDDLHETSVFGALLPRLSKTATLDVGVAWENAKVFPEGEVVPLANGCGRLWAWAQQGEQGRTIEYLVPTLIRKNTLEYSDQKSITRRWPVDDAHNAASERNLWMLPQPIAFAPVKAIEAAKSEFNAVNVWLHPATRLIENRAVHRPLHAKLLLIAFSAGSTQGTLVLVGSANMSRRALLLKAGIGQGNVELGLAFQLEGSYSLIDFVPELVWCPSSATELREREFPEAARNFATMIESAIHDAKEQSLVVTWADSQEDVPAWRLTYCGKEIAQSALPPSGSLVISDFVLQPSSAELILHVAGSEFAVPILVSDLIALPAVSAGAGIGLNELLMLLGRRIGAERAVQLAERNLKTEKESGALAAYFGEGFGPTDVFRAWWAVAEDLKDPELSVLAFRLRLEGAMGVGAAWSQMLEAATMGGSLQMSEVWFYGAELLRELAQIELSPAVDQLAKQEVLRAFQTRIRADLEDINLKDAGHLWMRNVRAFYEEAQ